MGTRSPLFHVSVLFSNFRLLATLNPKSEIARLPVWKTSDFACADVGRCSSLAHASGFPSPMTRSLYRLQPVLNVERSFESTLSRRERESRRRRQGEGVWIVGRSFFPRSRFGFPKSDEQAGCRFYRGLHWPSSRTSIPTPDSRSAYRSLAVFSVSRSAFSPLLAA